MSDKPVKLTPAPSGYADWLADLKTRIHSAQQRAALAVNRELVRLYWQIGHRVNTEVLDEHRGAAGAGQAAKLCNNMVLAVQQIAIGEAFVLAEKLGLPAQSLFDVITGATGNCWAVHTNCPVPGPVPTSPANNEFKPGFATALMNKDLGLAMAAVESTGSSAPLGTHAAEIYAAFASDDTHAGLDFSAIITTLRK